MSGENAKAKGAAGPKACAWEVSERQCGRHARERQPVLGTGECGQGGKCRPRRAYGRHGASLSQGDREPHSESRFESDTDNRLGRGAEESQEEQGGCQVLCRARGFRFGKAAPAH